MKYTIQRLDGRFSYRKWFDYYIGFSGRMSQNEGPLEFARAQHWFLQTYGWSAEIRQWSDIHTWYTKSVPLIAVKGGWTRPNVMPKECNPNWSWTNGYNDLRIYVASDKELAFFELAHQGRQ